MSAQSDRLAESTASLEASIKRLEEQRAKQTVNPAAPPQPQSWIKMPESQPAANVAAGGESKTSGGWIQLPK